MTDEVPKGLDQPNNGTTEIEGVRFDVLKSKSITGIHYLAEKLLTSPDGEIRVTISPNSAGVVPSLKNAGDITLDMTDKRRGFVGLSIQPVDDGEGVLMHAVQSLPGREGDLLEEELWVMIKGGVIVDTWAESDERVPSRRSQIFDAGGKMDDLDDDPALDSTGTFEISSLGKKVDPDTGFEFDRLEIKVNPGSPAGKLLDLLGLPVEYADGQDMAGGSSGEISLFKNLAQRILGHSRQLSSPEAKLLP